MKNLLKIAVIIFAATLFTACKDDNPDPTVDTSYFDRDVDYAQTDKEAIKKLHDFYSESTKDKEYYEVMQKAGIILNFSPSRQLLSLCGDQGSGWS
jgi:hypothetical protein